MQHFKFSLVVIVTALVTTRAQAEPVAGAQDPNQILQSAVDQIVAAEEFTADFELTVRVGLPGLDHGRFARYKIAMARLAVKELAAKETEEPDEELAEEPTEDRAYRSIAGPPRGP